MMSNIKYLTVLIIKLKEENKNEFRIIKTRQKLYRKNG